MHLFNSRRKFSVLSLVFLIVLLSIASIVFGTVGSAAVSSRNDEAQINQFAFLQNNPAALFFGGNAAQSSAVSSLVLRSNQSADVADSSVLDEFDAWVKSFVNNGYRVDRAQADAGENLASRRRELLKQLIETDPQAALARALPADVLGQLPDYITKYAEQRVSARGDFLVDVREGMNHSVAGKRGSKLSGSHTMRTVVVGDARYQASVYGRRETMTTKMDIPLQGIVIDDAMAVDETPARMTNKNAAPGEIERQTVFSDETATDRDIAEQIEWESKIEPTRAKASDEKRITGKNESETGIYSPDQTATAWTKGTKTLLVIRVEFPDKPGDPLDYKGQPFTAARAQSLYSEVNQFFVNNSYNNTSIQTTVVPELVRLPQTLAYYKNQYAQTLGFAELIADARAAAKEKNYDSEFFDFDVVAFSYTRLFDDALGVSSVGSKGSVLTGGFFLPQAAHELGHNYGLLHASLWRTTDGSRSGQGYSVEYGDCYDMMGDCSNIGINSHFNAAYKRLLDWLSDAEIRTITSNEPSITIYPQDSTAPGGLRAIKIKKDDSKNYWVEFRQGMNGALIRWDLGGVGFRQTELLDMNPATSGVSDAPLAVGQSFFDEENGVRITILRKNNAPESLDVQVEVNVTGCVYSLSSTNISVGSYDTPAPVETNLSTRYNCSWTATSDSNWINVVSGNSGTGSGTVSVSVANNPGGQPRTGTVTIGDQTFRITQAGKSCIPSINSTPTDFPTAGGALNYTNNGTCISITPAPDATSDWIKIDADQITVLPNTGLARQGVLKLVVVDFDNSTVTKLFPVRQAGQTVDCTFSISGSNQSILPAGGTGNFTLNASGSGCSWSAAASVPWITVNGNTSGTGSASINFTVSPSNVPARTGSITIGGQMLTVSQASGCVYSLQTASSAVLSASTGSGSFEIQSGFGCPWTATSAAPWITLNPNASGSGNGNISYAVTANADAARIGTISVAGQTFTVNQAAGKSRKRVRFF